MGILRFVFEKKCNHDLRDFNDQSTLFFIPIPKIAIINDDNLAKKLAEPIMIQTAHGMPSLQINEANVT